LINPSSSFNYTFNYGLKFLRSNSIENPKKEIEIFLCHLLSCSKFELYNHAGKSILLTKVNLLNEWLERRAKREPIQYIINNASFYGREFYVNKNVFIPRPESERLIEEAINHLRDFDSPKILEIGTGSGCLSISLAIEFPDSNVQSIDISEEAINVAKINSEKFQLNNISFKKLDFLKSEMKTFRNFDLLISNPPYIPKKDMESLMPEVRNFEPYSALTDYNDGLEFYRKFSNDLPYILNSNGIGIFEVGLSPHPKDAKNLFIKTGKSIKLLKDYNGDDRVLIVKL
tara:strand:+ start:93 stop:953 length:861 start_codon:yes stop_codon:yes gene_type:complete